MFECSSWLCDNNCRNNERRRRKTGRQSPLSSTPTPIERHTPTPWELLNYCCWPERTWKVIKWQRRMEMVAQMILYEMLYCWCPGCPIPYTFPRSFSLSSVPENIISSLYCVWNIWLERRMLSWRIRRSAADPLCKTPSIWVSEGCSPEEGDKESGTTIMWYSRWYFMDLEEFNRRKTIFQ